MKPKRTPAEVNIHLRAKVCGQTSIQTDNQAFLRILGWLDAPATAEELEGMDRLRSVQAPWLT